MNKSYQVVKADNNSISNHVFIQNTFSHYIKITKNNKSSIFLVNSNPSLNNDNLVMNQLQRTFFNAELGPKMKL